MNIVQFGWRDIFEHDDYFKRRNLMRMPGIDPQRGL